MTKSSSRPLSYVLKVILTAIIMAASSVAVINAQAAVATEFSQRSATPIKHLVIIFQENVSYDHYFTTYPRATNPANEPFFNADPNTPSTNGLTQQLIDNNPNSAKPFRLDRSMVKTCDQNHE